MTFPGAASPIWHPFTQHGLQPEMTPIVRAEGSYLYTADGKRVLDAISSWWVVTHGHCYPRLVEAAREQAGKLDQVIFAGHTHEPAEKLAAALVELAPKGLSRVFYSDSGSTAVEVAVKMALGYWYHSGQPQRQKLVVLENGYHGDTIGTMSIGERGVFNQAYTPLLFEVETIPFPSAGAEEKTIQAFRSCLQQHEGQVAALIVEPLVLGAGGMLIYSPAVLQELRALCDAHDIVMIADEVMTGWGRTGTLFACEQAGIAPDILCTSKGITGGLMPLAATLCQERFFDAHRSPDKAKMFFHSSSYTANPIACAVAAENVAIWQDEPVMERVKALETAQAERLAPFREDPRFCNVRQCGTITAVDLVVQDEGYLSGIGPRLYAAFQEQGLLLRPLGNTVYTLPPYSTTSDDLDQLYHALSNAPELL